MRRDWQRGGRAVRKCCSIPMGVSGGLDEDSASHGKNHSIIIVIITDPGFIWKRFCTY